MMIVRSAWSLDEPAAVMTWRYPALAATDFPSGAINAALAAIYNHPNESLDHPYLFVARDAGYQVIGLVVTDPESVELDLLDVGALYHSVLDSGAGAGPTKFWHSGGRRHKDVATRPSSNSEGDVHVIEWAFPEFIFPVDAINALLAGCYDVPCRPFIYPVYDRRDDESELRQVGLLICPTLDLAGDASENWREIRDRYNAIFTDDETYPHDVPWGQKEWSFDA